MPKTNLALSHAISSFTSPFAIDALLGSWRNLGKADIGKIHKYDSEAWADRFGETASPTAFNNTVGTLRMILVFGIELGARHDNPSKLISKHRIRLKNLELPS